MDVVRVCEDDWMIGNFHEKWIKNLTSCLNNWLLDFHSDESKCLSFAHWTMFSCWTMLKSVLSHAKLEKCNLIRSTVSLYIDWKQSNGLILKFRLRKEFSAPFFFCHRSSVQCYWLRGKYKGSNLYRNDRWEFLQQILNVSTKYKSKHRLNIINTLKC